MTVKETFDNFILSRRLADLSPKTIENYDDFVSPFISFIGSNKLFVDVQQTDINNYIFLLLSKPLSKSTKATYIRHLKVYLSWCEAEYGASYVSKKIKVPRSFKKEVCIYSPTDVQLIFDLVQSDLDWIMNRNKCIIALMYDSGLRQSEVCALLKSHISFSENRAIVFGKGNKERIVPLGRLTQYYLKIYIDTCPYSLDLLFVTKNGKPLTCNAVKLMITRLASQLPFELSSHKLRHNFATNYCIDQYNKYGQVDIYRLMYLMGHEDVKTTRRYLHFAYEIIAARTSVSHLDTVYNSDKKF